MVCGSKKSGQCIHPMKGWIRLDQTWDKVSEDRAGFRWKDPAGSLSLSLYNILNLPWISKWPYSKAVSWSKRSFQLFRICLYLLLISRVYTYVYAYHPGGCLTFFRQLRLIQRNDALSHRAKKNIYTPLHHWVRHHQKFLQPFATCSSGCNDFGALMIQKSGDHHLQCLLKP